jgi:hypothetical protein
MQLRHRSNQTTTSGGVSSEGARRLTGCGGQVRIEAEVSASSTRWAMRLSAGIVRPQNQAARSGEPQASAAEFTPLEVTAKEEARDGPDVSGAAKAAGVRCMLRAVAVQAVRTTCIALSRAMDESYIPSRWIASIHPSRRDPRDAISPSSSANSCRCCWRGWPIGSVSPELPS